MKELIEKLLNLDEERKSLIKKIDIEYNIYRNIEYQLNVKIETVDNEIKNIINNNNFYKSFSILEILYILTENKINAIKEYRNRNKVDLREAKSQIEILIELLNVNKEQEE